MEVRLAETPADLDEVRRLCRAFVAWHRERHVDKVDLIDAYFDAGDFQRELDGAAGQLRRRPTAYSCFAHQDVRRRRLCGLAAPRRRVLRDEADVRASPPPRGGAPGGCWPRRWSRERGRRLPRRCTWTPASSRSRRSRSIAAWGSSEVAPYYELPPTMAEWMVFMRLAL